MNTHTLELRVQRVKIDVYSFYMLTRVVGGVSHWNSQNN